MLIFQEIFCIIVIEGYKNEDKVLRNELLIVIINLIEEGLFVKALDSDFQGLEVAELLAINWKSE